MVPWDETVRLGFANSTVPLFCNVICLIALSSESACMCMAKLVVAIKRLT